VAQISVQHVRLIVEKERSKGDHIGVGPRQRQWGVALITLIGGVVPATVLLIPAVMLGVGGAHDIFVVPSAATVFAVAGLLVAILGLLGYGGLVVAVWKPVDCRLASMLSFGVVASVYGMWLAGPSRNEDWYVFYPPLIVGLAHIISYLRSFFWSMPKSHSASTIGRE
jgi:hypothetical protein